MVGLLLVLALLDILRWQDYADCEDPLGLWLLVSAMAASSRLIEFERGFPQVDYLGFALFRLLHILFACVSERRSRGGVRRFFAKLISALNVYVLFPFLVIWTGMRWPLAGWFRRLFSL